MRRAVSAAEPLDNLLHLGVSKFVGLDAYTTYGVLSCIAGGFFVFLMLHLCDLLGENRSEKLLILPVILTMGANQLFLGYIETYTLMYAALAGYLLFAVRYLRGQGRFWLPCVFMVLAAGFHLSAMFIFPSLFYLAFASVPRGGRQNIRSSLITNAAILACVTAFMILGYYFVRLGSPEGSTGHLLIYPFGGGDESYSFYSPAHLLDFLNHQFLASPVNVVLWTMVAFFLRKMVSFKEPVVKFLVLLSLCSLGFALLVDPKLGYARDWDLFAFTGLGATILALFLIVDSLRDRDETDDRDAWRPAYGRRKERTLDLRRVSVALVATSVVSTLPWIWVNASPQKAVARFEDLLRMDRRARGHGYETLACYSRDRGEHERSVDWWNHAVAADPNPRYLGALGNAYRRLGDHDKAIEAYHRSLRTESRFPGAASVHKNLGDVLVKVGRLEEAVVQLRQAIDLKPGRTEIHRSLGMTLGRLGRYREAVPHLEMALESDPGDAALYRALTICYAATGSKDDAGAYLEAYLSFRPEDARKMKEIMDSIEIGARISMPAESREVRCAVSDPR